MIERRGFLKGLVGAVTAGVSLPLFARPATSAPIPAPAPRPRAVLVPQEAERVEIQRTIHQGLGHQMLEDNFLRFATRRDAGLQLGQRVAFEYSGQQYFCGCLTRITRTRDGFEYFVTDYLLAEK